MSRAAFGLSGLVAVIEQQQKFWKFTDLCTEHLIRCAKKSPHAAYPVLNDLGVKGQLDFLLNWLAMHPHPPKPSEVGRVGSLLLVKPCKQQAAFGTGNGGGGGEGTRGTSSSNGGGGGGDQEQSDAELARALAAQDQAAASYGRYGGGGGAGGAGVGGGSTTVMGLSTAQKKAALDLIVQGKPLG